MTRAGENTRSTPAAPQVDVLEPRRLLAAQLVADLGTGAEPSHPEHFVSLNEHAYFLARPAKRWGRRPRPALSHRACRRCARAGCDCRRG